MPDVADMCTRTQQTAYILLPIYPALLTALHTALLTALLTSFTYCFAYCVCGVRNRPHAYICLRRRQQEQQQRHDLQQQQHNQRRHSRCREVKRGIVVRFEISFFSPLKVYPFPPGDLLSIFDAIYIARELLLRMRCYADALHILSLSLFSLETISFLISLYVVTSKW